MLAVIIVPAGAVGVSSTDKTFADTLQADPAVDPNSIPVLYEANGASVLQSLVLGTNVEFDVSATGTLTGSGTITGAVDPALGNIALFDNFGTTDINGAIDVGFSNDGQLTVSAGEKLDVEGDLYSLFGTVTVAAGGELDVNSNKAGLLTSLNLLGTLVASAPNTSIQGSPTLGGALIVHGDAPSAYGTGVSAARAGGAYVATLDLRSATLSAPIGSLALGVDAKVQLGSGALSVGRLVVAGAAGGVSPIDILTVGGTLTVGTGASFSGALLAGGGTFDLAVATAGGATLQQATIDTMTTLRNDGVLTVGAGAGTTMVGSAAGAAGSSFVNSATGVVNFAGGAALGAASVQNAGTFDITSGTVSFGAGVSGAGALIVESGATVGLGASSTFAGSLQIKGSGRVDLAGVSASGATVAGGKIVVAASGGTFSLNETGLVNGTTLSVAADGSGGSLIALAGQGSSPGTPTPTPVVHSSVYRFFDKVHGTHFFTGSAAESASVQASRSDLTYEGVGLSSVDPATDGAAAPVYRFFDTKFGTHFYTSSASEKDSTVANRSDLKYEGIDFYEHASAQAGDVAVVRYFDKNFGTHFYSSSTSEQASIAASRPDLVNEGIGFYTPSS